MSKGSLTLEQLFILLKANLLTNIDKNLNQFAYTSTNFVGKLPNTTTLNCQENIRPQIIQTYKPKDKKRQSVDQVVVEHGARVWREPTHSPGSSDQLVNSISFVLLFFSSSIYEKLYRINRLVILCSIMCIVWKNLCLIVQELVRNQILNKLVAEP